MVCICLAGPGTSSTEGGRTCLKSGYTVLYCTQLAVPCLCAEVLRTPEGTHRFAAPESYPAALATPYPVYKGVSCCSLLHFPHLTILRYTVLHLRGNSFLTAGTSQPPGRTSACQPRPTLEHTRYRHIPNLVLAQLHSTVAHPWLPWLPWPDTRSHPASYPRSAGRHQSTAITAITDRTESTQTQRPMRPSC